jgi:CHASE1-domain containing sensor protein
LENRRKDGGFLGQPAWLWSLGALLVGLALSLLAASLHRDALARSEQTRLERLAERSFDAVDSQLQTCGLLVRSVQALFLASDEVTIDEFEAMYSNLRPREQFPSLQAIAYAVKTDRPSPDAAPDGQLRYPTVLVAPMQGNRMLMGLDIATQPANLAAAQFSRDADQPVMSAAFRLIQRANMPGSDDGLTIRLPVFSPGPQPRDLAERRAREMGSLAASFRVNRLIEDALPREALDRFDLEVLDISDGEAAPRLL